MKIWRVLAACVALGACGERRSEAPAPAPRTAKLDPRDEAFHFGPTFTAHRPPGDPLTVLLEVGDATQREMKAVVARMDGDSPQVALWRFEMQGPKDTLVPAEGPNPLLPLTASEAVDEPALQSLRTQMAAGHAVVTRPQGLDEPSASDALDAMHGGATTVFEASAAPGDRVAALVRFTRGLDDDLLLEPRGLARALAVLVDSTRLVDPPQPGTRRVTIDRSGHAISMLRKSGGWVITGIAKQS